MKHRRKHHAHGREHARFGDHHRHGRKSDAHAPQLERAIQNLKTTLKLNAESSGLTDEQICAIADALDEASRKIEQCCNAGDGRGIETRKSVESRSQATPQRAASLQMPSANGVCCGNCRICREPVCIKTGLAKRRRHL